MYSVADPILTRPLDPLLVLYTYHQYNSSVMKLQNNYRPKRSFVHSLGVGGWWSPIWGGCGLQFFGGGVSNFSGGGVVSNFLGGGGVVSNFLGGCLQFFRGSPIWGGVSNFFLGGRGGLRNTVNVRPVCILLECILVKHVAAQNITERFPK